MHKDQIVINQILNNELFKKSILKRTKKNQNQHVLTFKTCNPCH
jgi:hypothetical protein